ncbi:MAG: peptide chain release factor N(5)-glutamine methyltransferase [Pyrinomonadaceae bacterium]
MPTIDEKLNEVEAILKKNVIPEPRREASLLIGLALKRDRTFLIAHPEYDLDPRYDGEINDLVRRRALHEPFQYISGVQEFYGLEFEVTPDVLIPRPETEMLVEHGLEILGKSSGNSVCDVGTGSGCIAVSMLHEMTRVHATALDASKNALKVAGRNADKHGVRDRLELLESDVFSSLDAQKFDLVVSNPPYVPADDIEGLQAEVRDFEPHTALTDWSDGLSIIRRIVNESPNFLSHDGHLLVEIGFDQSPKVAEMFDHTRWHSPDLFHDLQGIPRLVSAQLR